MLLQCKQTSTKNVPTSQFAVFSRYLTSQLDLFDFLTFAVEMMILWCYYYLSCTHTPLIRQTHLNIWLWGWEIKSLSLIALYYIGETALSRGLLIRPALWPLSPSCAAGCLIRSGSDRDRWMDGVMSIESWYNNNEIVKRGVSSALGQFPYIVVSLSNNI